jgi:eukaryotic-like serine/threonine-protein kinase
MSVGGPRGQADLTAGQYGSVLNRGSYFAHCGVGDNMGISICAAVQNGRAVGVTVVTKPRDRRAESCIAAGVRGLSFPSHPKLDVSRTNF